MPSLFPDFRHQDLRNRSFVGQKLAGADFRAADLRGCDFRRAILTEARFEGCRLGQTGRQRGVWLLAMVGSGGLVANALARLIFAAIGQTPGEKAWTYVLVLYGFLALAGLSMASVLLVRQRLLQRGGEVVAGAAIGALTGFFYGGYWTANNSLIAILTAIGLGVVGALACLLNQSGTRTLLLLTTGTITTYAFSFFIGARALALVVTDHWGAASAWGIVTLGALWLTFQGLKQLPARLGQTPGTLFRQAVLTGAQFASTNFSQADFRGAIDPPETVTKQSNP